MTDTRYSLQAPAVESYEARARLLPEIDAAMPGATIDFGELSFPGGPAFVPKPSANHLLRSAQDWLGIAGRTVGDLGEALESSHPGEIARARMVLARLRSQLEHAERALREAK